VPVDSTIKSSYLKKGAYLSRSVFCVLIRFSHAAMLPLVTASVATRLRPPPVHAEPHMRRQRGRDGRASDQPPHSRQWLVAKSHIPQWNPGR